MIQLSVIIPLLNVINYFDYLIQSVLLRDGIDQEIFLVDGGSTDGTIEKIKRYQEQFPNITLVNNQKQFVSYGFNKTYPLTKGKYITLMGAYAEYPKGFFTIGISFLESNECDVVGGSLKQLGKTLTGKAIAF